MELPWNQTCARAQKLLIEESTLEIRFALGSKLLVERRKAVVVAIYASGTVGMDSLDESSQMYIACKFEELNTFLRKKICNISA